jgi:hypothetical protein
MKIKIPKFTFHGTTQRYCDILVNDSHLKLTRSLQCWDCIQDGISFAQRRAMQDRICFSGRLELNMGFGLPVLLIIDSETNQVRKKCANIFEVLERLNPNGYLAINLYYFETERGKYDRQYEDLYMRQFQAKELSDFLTAK